MTSQAQRQCNKVLKWNPLWAHYFKDINTGLGLVACAPGRGSQVESEFQVSLCYVGETMSQENKTKGNKPEGYNCNWAIEQIT